MKIEKSSLYNFKDKNIALNHLVREYFNRCLSMFEYENLPDTIKKRNIETQLLHFGHSGIAEVKGDLYCFNGGLNGAERSPYYDFTRLTVANPALNFSKNMTDGEDIALIRNTPDWSGIMNILRRYCTIIVEGNLSLNMWASFGSRINSIIAASDERTKLAGELYIEDIIKGKYSVIGESAFLDGIKVNPLNSGSNNNIINLLELLQYSQAELNKALGLEANSNRKREALSSSETESDLTTLIPLIDIMLEMREEGLDKVNKMFGTNIKVKKSSAWSIIEEDIKDSIEEQEETKEDKEETNKEENEEKGDEVDENDVK